MLNRFVPLFVIAGSLSCMAQEYEIGAAGGYGFYKNATITRGTTEAHAGFSRGFAASILAGHQMHGPLGGEVRYVYRDNDLRLSSGGQNTKFDGRSHILHYDALLTGGSRESRFRPYIAFGGGIKVYQGTGVEQEFQPLGRFAALTKTHEWVPLVSVGAGAR